MMLDRIIIAVIVVAAGVSLFVLWSRVRLLRVRRTEKVAPGLETLMPGRAAILYFTTPTCVPCKTVQMPALEELKSELDGQLQIIRIDATEQHRVADFWGVLSVPTTFVIDRTGHPRRVNDGVANAEKLKTQLRELGVIE